MTDPSIERFRRVVRAAYAYLEARRQEVNDLNVFPVADGDTGDNMALTMRAVMAELDRLDGGPDGTLDREQIVHAVARAALMGARGNSGVILSQIVRGAAEELASRPGQLIDPELVAAALASAVDAAYDSVRDPTEGTMLTVIREIANAIARGLAHMEKQRLDGDATDAEQDALLSEVLEKAVAAGTAAVERTPEQLNVLRDSGVVDAGAHGLVLIIAGIVAGLRGENGDVPEVAHQEPARMSVPHHADSRFRYCANYVVTGSGLEARPLTERLESIGDSVLVVGDPATLRVHVHTDDPATVEGWLSEIGEVGQADIADMQAQVAERDARLGSRPARTAVVAVASGAGLRELYEGLGAWVVDGGNTMNPSTHELLAGIHETGADEVIVLPNSPNVILAAERAAELADRPTRVLPCTSPQAGLAALVELDEQAAAEENAERLARALEDVRVGAVAPAARDDPQGRFVRGDAVGFCDGEIVAWGGAGSTLGAVIERLAEDAEIVTVIEGAGAPLRGDELPAKVPEGVEIELHGGAQPSYWWLLAAQ